MKIRTMFLVLALCAFQAFPLRAGKVVTDSLYSAVLGAQVRYNVYLPDSYGSSDAKYPVIYLLHGLYGSYSNWVERGSMKGIADELISSGEALPMVIIMPNAGHPDARNNWNGYFNMPGWSYEDFFFSELIPVAEGKYRCLGDKGHRAVMGFSMGGGGSTVYCQRHPDMFCCCYAMSPWLDNKTDEVGRYHAPGDKLDLVCRSVCEHSALDFVRTANDDVLEALRGVAWLLDCGDDDFLLEQSEDLHRLMKAARVKCELRVRNGAHTWEYWHQALRLALPYASLHFRAE